MTTATLNAISHSDLPAAMAAVARFAAGKRCPRPILQNVMLSTGVAGTMVAATDLETLCVVHMPGGSGDGKTLLPASMAKQIAKDKCATVEYDDAGEASTVSACGMTAAAEDTLEFPHCWPLDPAAPAIRIPFEVVDQIDGACSPATDTESSRYALGGVLLETSGDDKLYAIGTDGRRLHALGASATVDAPLMTVVRPGAIAGGTCLAEDAARAACNVLAESWASNIRLGYGNGGPSGPEVEQMILGDLRDTLDALERLLGVIERQGDE